MKCYNITTRPLDKFIASLKGVIFGAVVITLAWYLLFDNKDGIQWNNGFFWLMLAMFLVSATYFAPLVVIEALTWKICTSDTAISRRSRLTFGNSYDIKWEYIDRVKILWNSTTIGKKASVRRIVVYGYRPKKGLFGTENFRIRIIVPGHILGIDEIIHDLRNKVPDKFC